MAAKGKHRHSCAHTVLARACPGMRCALNRRRAACTCMLARSTPDMGDARKKEQAACMSVEL
eukprot:15465053-Alexandrium_andersonii.AAC.1